MIVMVSFWVMYMIRYAGYYPFTWECWAIAVDGEPLAEAENDNDALVTGLNPSLSNPFCPRTTINFTVDKPDDISFAQQTKMYFLGKLYATRLKIKQTYVIIILPMTDHLTKITDKSSMHMRDHVSQLYIIWYISFHFLRKTVL